MKEIFFMKKDEKMESILSEYVEQIKNIFGSSLKAVILYGSYARGDFNEYSDIDIMVLVSLTDNEIKAKSDEFSDLTFETNYDNDIEIMPIVKNIDHFEKWLNAYPFYNNIEKEGIELYAA